MGSAPVPEPSPKPAPRMVARLAAPVPERSSRVVVPRSRERTFYRGARPTRSPGAGPRGPRSPRSCPVVMPKCRRPRVCSRFGSHERSKQALGGGPAPEPCAKAHAPARENPARAYRPTPEPRLPMSGSAEETTGLPRYACKPSNGETKGSPGRASYWVQRSGESGAYVERVMPWITASRNFACKCGLPATTLPLSRGSSSPALVA